MSFEAFDYQCMALAIQLAKKGWYTADPNPRVGCVIARGGQIVGEGYHHRAGEAHAEVNALNAAGEHARNSVAYVTLEPCNHQGRTGPCSRALIQAGVAEVIYGMIDPHQTASGGIAALEGAGIRVRGPLLESRVRALNPGFIKRCETGLPLVTLKLAMSLDGRTAMASGESRWITGEDARRDVQRLRAGSSAIVTGIGSVLGDNPSMTVRENALPLENAAEVAGKQPLRVILDSGLRTPAEAKLLGLEGEVVIATAQPESAFKSTFPAGVTQVSLPGNNGKVNLRELLAYLAGRECNEVLVEAGPEVCGAFMASGLVDKLVVYMAGRLMGSSARPLMCLPLDSMSETIELKIEEIRAVGDDWRITAAPEKYS